MLNLKPRSKPRQIALQFARIMMVCLLTLFVIYGCTQIRKVTYPSDYVYLDKKEIDSNMALLGFYVRQIDEVFNAEPSVVGDEQTRILSLLANINKTTKALLVGNRATNHVLIDEHMDEFRVDVTNAMRGARENPPNYTGAQKISDACIDCHQFRGKYP